VWLPKRCSKVTTQSILDAPGDILRAKSARMGYLGSIQSTHYIGTKTGLVWGEASDLHSQQCVLKVGVATEPLVSPLLEDRSIVWLKLPLHLSTSTCQRH
jgi:hypothetical protein